MKEIWKDVKGYEGIYKASNTGKIKSLDRVSAQGASIKGTMLKCGISSSGKGYYQVSLCKNGKPKKVSVHRIIAETFIPNPKNLPCINHKDEVRFNNNVDNLEWCTHKYNNNYGTHVEKIQKSMDYESISKKLRKTNTEKYGIKVAQKDMNGNLIATFDSFREAERETGAYHSNISRCCKGVYKQTDGYIWEYVE